MSEHDQLLVVGPQRTNAHVKQALTTRRLDRFAQVPVLARTELEPVQMRAPDQTPDVYSPADRGREDLTDLAARTLQLLVLIAPPICEHQQVPWSHRLDRVEQLAEVRRTVHERLHVIPRRPGEPVGVPTVQHGVRIAALLRSEEPQTRIGSETIAYATGRLAGQCHDLASAPGADSVQGRLPDPNAHTGSR